MEVYKNKLLIEPTACEIAASPVIASVTVKESHVIPTKIPYKQITRAAVLEAEVFCKTNSSEKEYFDIRAEGSKEVVEPVFKTTEVDTSDSLVCKIAGADLPICKKMEDADRDTVKQNKDSVVFSKTGDREILCVDLSLQRQITGSRRGPAETDVRTVLIYPAKKKACT